MNVTYSERIFLRVILRVYYYLYNSEILGCKRQKLARLEGEVAFVSVNLLPVYDFL